MNEVNVNHTIIETIHSGIINKMKSGQVTNHFPSKNM